MFNVCGAGVGLPDSLGNCVEARYFSHIHYLALSCNDDLLSARLQARPAWRNCSDPPLIADQIAFNSWFVAQGRDGDLPITVLDSGRI